MLDSAGSVVPLFRKQIKNGGPVTVTDKKVIRYFMSIPEAVQLVIQAGSMSLGGDVFILDMGKPVNIYEMAIKMIYLSGLKPIINDNSGDIEIKIIGMRPGEKMYEELLISNDSIKTQHPRIFKATEPMQEFKIIKESIIEIKKACSENNVEKLKAILKKYIDFNEIS